MPSKKLRHRVISIAEEQGASKAAYSLKLLQSEGSLSIASTGKDMTTGQLVSHEYRVEGPVALMMTTTAIDVDDELLSRCLVLTVDEGPEQTRKIQERQRWATTLEGRLRGRDEARLVHLHQNAQRLVRPVLVVNPLAADIVFPDRRVRARRDHPKLLGLVETIALLHQHQRQLKRADHEGVLVEYIEVEPADVDTATRLLEGLGLGDATELPPQTRKLLEGLLAVRNEASDRQGYRFTRRDVRERLGVGSTQAKVHLKRLVEAEYVLVHRSPHGRGVVYELAYDDERSALEGERSGVGRPKVGGMSAGGRPSEIDTNVREDKPIDSTSAEIAANARLGDQVRDGRTDGAGPR